MKRVLLISLFLFLSVALFAEPSWLGLDFSIEIGWVPRGLYGSYECVEKPCWYNGIAYTYDIKKKDISNSFYTKLDANIWLFKYVFLGGGVGTVMYWDMDSFNPTFLNFIFRSGMAVGWVSLFYEHQCSHPEFTYFPYYKILNARGEGSFDAIILKVQAEFK